MLEKCRLTWGFDQRKFCKEFGWSESHYRRILRGERQLSVPELGEMHSTFANRRDGGIYEKLLLLAVKHREHEQLEQIVSKLLPDDYDLVWEITSLLTMRHDRSTLKRVICLLTQPARYLTEYLSLMTRFRVYVVTRGLWILSRVSLFM